jgi:broad specificity phosphatase PhoE
MNKYFIVRHGESENNILEIDCSKLENKDKFGLTEKGKKEAESEAQKYRNLDLIITSPFRRTKEAAMIFAKTSQCEVIEDELLSEVDFGDFELCKY